MRISRSALEEIDRHAEEGYPYEICGAMLGPAGAGTVTAVRRIDNAIPDDALRRTRYRLDDRQHVRVQREADDHGLEIIGYYHSHPDHGAYFSKTDTADSWMNVTYLVVACERGRAGERKAFMALRDHGPVREEPLEVV